MKLIFLLYLIMGSSLQAEVKLISNEGFSGTNIVFNKNSELSKENSKIKVTFDNKKNAECKLDLLANIYICSNSGKPILIKKTAFGYMAIGRNDQNSIEQFNVQKIESNGKVLVEVPDYKKLYPGLGNYNDKFKFDSPDLNKEYLNKVLLIDMFFKKDAFFADPNASLEIPNGSIEFKTIAASFIEEKESIKKQVEKAAREDQYQIELDDGQKLKCARGETRPLTKNEIDANTKYGMFVQCGAFSCGKITQDGNEYEAIMLFESGPGNESKPTLHLVNSKGIKPASNVKKVFSKDSKIPLIENSTTEYVENAVKSYRKNLQNYLPEQLTPQEKESIVYYKQPSISGQISYYADICKDKERIVKNLIDGKAKVVEALAKIELKEFIQILANGSLVSDFIDPTLAPYMGCSYEGVYLNEEAAKNLNVIKRNINPDKQIKETISLKRANQLFKKAIEMKDIAWKYKEDGCYARAHLMAKRFEKEGIRVDKVWIKGELSVPEAGLRWNFHVAPVVYVEEKGKIQKMVIDPSLFDKPVTVEEWDKKMVKGTVRGSVQTVFPFPENAAAMERSALAFSSSDIYVPKESIFQTEKEKMDLAEETMARYIKIQ